MSCLRCNDIGRVEYKGRWRKCACQRPTKLHNAMMAKSSLSSWRTWQGDREDFDRLPFGLKLAITTGRRAGLTNVEIAELANVPLFVVAEVD